MNIKLDREYEIRCTLGTIKDIESAFGKGFFAIVGSIDKMTTTEQIKLLYLGAKRANATLTEETFAAACDDYLGLGELTDYLEQFIYQLQYPGLAKEEIQQKIEKKLRQAEKMKGSIGTK